MAMERIRAMIMQQDKTGLYRDPNSLQQAPTLREVFGTTEASEKDHFGHPENCPVGQIFANRKACYDAKVHRATMKGIVGNISEGAYSIVVNEGYEDDIDQGDVIYYTGAGGQNNHFGQTESQSCDQTFDHPSNRALLRNTLTRHPVRVIRGSSAEKYGPHRGYRYDGLYDVVEAVYDKGKSGYTICRFKLQRRAGQTALKDLPR